MRANLTKNEKELELVLNTKTVWCDSNSIEPDEVRRTIEGRTKGERPIKSSARIRVKTPLNRIDFWIN
jgi:hypothetical protein